MVSKVDILSLYFSFVSFSDLLFFEKIHLPPEFNAKIYFVYIVWRKTTDFMISAKIIKKNMVGKMAGILDSI